MSITFLQLGFESTALKPDAVPPGIYQQRSFRINTVQVENCAAIPIDCNPDRPGSKIAQLLTSRFAHRAVVQATHVSIYFLGIKFPLSSIIACSQQRNDRCKSDNRPNSATQTSCHSSYLFAEAERTI